ncbi:hypothetical protein [Nonomuraea sp. NPDC049400]|uniref:hypothetical protein n=1 Tax=Nonomuraea sp. NPDC049400 TaxID=3364352 RepID=UPI00378CF89D
MSTGEVQECARKPWQDASGAGRGPRPGGGGGAPGKSFVLSDSTRVRADDQLLVVTTAACRDQVERRLRAVSRRSKLAGWYGERGLG